MREPNRTERVVQGLLAMLCIAPLLMAFCGSGGLADAYGSHQPAGSEAAARYLALLSAGGRSLLLAALTTVVAAGIGIPAAWALAKSGRPLLLLIVCALPLALPASVAVSGWIRIFAPGAASSFNPPAIAAGPAIPMGPNGVMGPAGQVSRGLLFSVFGAALLLAFSLWPLIALELWPAFRRARNESYDAAVLNGSRVRAFLRVVLPQCAGELAAGALLTFLLALSDFSVGSLLLVRTLPIEIHDALTLGKSATAAWSALPLVILVALAALAFSRFSAYRASSGAPVQAPAAPSSSFIVLAMSLAGVALGFVIPMTACALGISWHGRSIAEPFTVSADALSLSVRLAAAVALLSALIGIVRLLAWPDTRTGVLNAAGLFLLAIPGSFLAAAIFTLQLSAASWADALQWGRLAALIPAASLGLALLARFMYVPLRLMDEGLRALDPEILESATLAGHNRLSVAVSVALPLLLPHLAASTALVFILALGEIPLADKLSAPGAITAMVWLFQQQHMGYDSQVFGLSFLMGAVCAGILALAGGAAALARRALHLSRSTEIS